MPHHYHLFGLTIASDLELPELLSAPSDVPVDIHVLLEPLSEHIDESLRLTHPTFFHPNIQFGQGVFQMEVDGVARYRVEGGSRILVAPVASAVDIDLRAYLLGTAIGVLLHQRRLLPLHVCAVALDGQVHAFCGQSGAGKSTLAAAFHLHGYPMLSDDVGVVVPTPDGRVMFYPGFPRIKLWRDTLNHFDIDQKPLVRDVSRADKFHLALHELFGCTPMPLRRLYALERGEACSSPKVDFVGKPQAVGLLIEHTYRTELVRDAGDAKSHLQQCARVAQSIGCFRFTRPWNLGREDETFDFIAKHMKSEGV